MTVAQLLTYLQDADPNAEVCVGCTVELVDRVEVVNQPHVGTPYVVLLPALTEWAI